MKSFVIGPNDCGQRVDKFILKAGEKLPKSLLYKAIRKKDVKLNRKRCYPETVLSLGDILEIYLSDEFFPTEVDLSFLRAGNLAPPAYEDENILVAEKPMGLLSHGTREESVDTLINQVKKYLYGKGEYRPERENAFAPATCSRLDRNTGGLVLCAKNAQALRELNGQIRDRRVDKFYLALVQGRLQQREGVVTGALEKDKRTNTVTFAPGGKESRSTYKVIWEGGENTLVSVKLITGRTHQIRIHFSGLGHPLVGDKKYGGTVRKGWKGQALYAFRLVFHMKPNMALAYLDGMEVKARQIPRWASKNS